MTTIKDVAAYILKREGAMSAMKLQKLCYYAQAWSMVWDEAPLFDDRIEAWANGPVAPALYAAHRGLYTVSQIMGGSPDALTSDQTDTIDSVLRSYGALTAHQLSKLTHSEDPWRLARRGLAPTDRGQTEISIDSMRVFYAALLERDDTEVL